MVYTIEFVPRAATPCFNGHLTFHGICQAQAQNVRTNTSPRFAACKVGTNMQNACQRICLQKVSCRAMLLLLYLAFEL